VSADEHDELRRLEESCGARFDRDHMIDGGGQFLGEFKCTPALLLEDDEPSALRGPRGINSLFF
jgi:hypothetical protein